MRYIKFHGGKTHPRELNHLHVEQFLSSLTMAHDLSASTQSQALNGLVFLYNEVLQLPLQGQIRPKRGKRKPSPPNLLTQEEAKRLLAHVQGVFYLMAGLYYGSGLRLLECLRLRIMDVDVGQLRVFVRGARAPRTARPFSPAAWWTH